MNIYSVYVNSKEKDQDPIIIKQGISLLAGIFNFIWALYYKMWFIAFLTILANVFANKIGISYIANFINISILFVFTIFASDLREFYAKKTGAELSDIIFAYGDDEAEFKYYVRSKLKEQL